ncbi:hypothetical protein T01_3294 [Trichinella spiralis]|uniref:Uncharacterized protein n=1 Tax=Trichinella spiralis TaxID=6334 RepID=A0A0V1BNJ9_TRISP|nr:hypothetical protein T01_3294 [Trichinella spiralis]
MHEGTNHLLKHTNFDEKPWIFNRVRNGCRDTVYTNLEVNTVLRTTPHAAMTDCRIRWRYAYDGAVLKSCC